MTVLVAVGIALAGIAVGVFSALFGVGGGVLMVPFMILALGMTQHAAEGTSLAVIVPTAIAGVIAHSRRGYVSFRHAAVMAAGGIGGAYAGARLAHAISGETLQAIFGAFVLLTGARLAWQAYRGRERLRDV